MSGDAVTPEKYNRSKMIHELRRKVQAAEQAAAAEKSTDYSRHGLDVKTKTSQPSQKHSHRESKTTRRRMKNKMTHQKKMYLHKVPKLNLQKGGKYDSTDLDHSSSRTTLTSVHDSGCSTASDGTLRNFSADANNDQRNISYDEQNLSSPGGYESPKSSKHCSVAKVMKQNVLAPESQDTVKVSSPQQRKAYTESLNVKMTAKAMAARQKALAPSPPNPMKPPPSYQKGVLPKYLVSRQEEQQKEEKVRQLRDPDCPPGYVRLPDIERRETLRILRKYYGDLIQGMNMLPVQTPVKKIQQKKMDIEKQLEKLNAAIKVFSKSKVFMKVDNKVLV